MYIQEAMDILSLPLLPKLKENDHIIISYSRDKLSFRGFDDKKEQQLDILTWDLHYTKTTLYIFQFNTVLYYYSNHQWP